MKIRSGFVSNSSSSSFIISETEFDKISCPNCKKILELLFEKKKAQDIILEDDYWKGDIQNYYIECEEYHASNPMFNHCKNDDTIYFKKMEMDESQIVFDILKALNVKYEYEEH